jgi:cyclophilin family peptidyl-prolyl cis-trans isomerase
MKHKYSRTPQGLVLTILGCFATMAWVGSARGQEPGEPRGTSSQLTPEQRQERKQAKLQKELEAEQRRVQTFGIVPEEDTNPLAVAYRKASDEFRLATAEFAEMQARLQFRFDNSDSESLKTKWVEKLKNNHEKMIAWRNRGAELYASDPERYEPVGWLLREMLIADAAVDRLDHWAPAAKALLAAERLVTDEVLLNAGYVGFAACDWELTEMAWAPLGRAGKLSVIESRIMQELPNLKASWAKEQERRREDASKNNPRVEFVTTKGTIVIELFEDDAPEAVNSFVFLVEKGYYDRKPIFLVRQHWLAQTGCEKGDGKGTAGYTIPLEATLPNHRKHFRGSLGIPLAMNTETGDIDPNSGGAQFYFSFLPLPPFDGKHTVFGRIVDGIETLGWFKTVNLTDEEERKDTSIRPDLVVKARVLNKRDHPYRPTPVLGRLPN